MKKLRLISVITLSVLLSGTSLYSQGVKISNSSGDPHQSAILELESTTQGLLIPRMTSAERLSIASPSEGLLVFDSDKNAFFLMGKVKWVDLSSSSEIWTRSSSNVYLSNSTDNIGIGTNSPTSKFVIQADAGKADDDILFEVKDKSGNQFYLINDRI